MPLIRLNRHQAIQIATRTETTTITPHWGERLDLKLVSTHALNNYSVRPRGYTVVPFEIVDGEGVLRCTVFLQKASKNWMVDMRGSHLFNISRIPREDN